MCKFSRFLTLTGKKSNSEGCTGKICTFTWLCSQYLLCSPCSLYSLRKQVRHIMNIYFINAFVNQPEKACPTTLPIFSQGPCVARCLQIPGCYHHIWDDPGRLSWTQRHRVALCYHRRGPPPQEQELQAARGLQAHEPGTYSYFFYLNAKLRTLCVVPVILHSIRSNKVFLYTMKNCKLSCLLSGTQGPADRYSSPEYSGGALQLAPLPGAGTLSLRKHLHAGVWRPQDWGAGEHVDT